MAPRSPYRRAYERGAGGQDLDGRLTKAATEDPRINEAHELGRQGGDFTKWEAAHTPPKAVPRSPRNPPRPTAPPASVPLKRYMGAGSAAETGAGVLLGLVAYALVLSVVEHGSTGPLLWFKAKFLNETPSSAKTSSTGSSVKAALA